MRTVLAILLTGAFSCSPAAALDVMPLWDFKNPERSEANFRTALRTATGDDALVLQTQIARTYSLRKQFDRARELLRTIEPQIQSAGAEPRTRYWLELGRTYASHRHAESDLTAASKELARQAYLEALRCARDAKLDGLAVDAIHMFAFVDTEPAQQLARGREALALVEASDQPQAKRWEASIRSNIGEALFDLERYDEALDQFRQSLSLRKRENSPTEIRDAEWLVARVLRMKKQTDEALAIQLRILRESEAENARRPYIYEELALLYEARGDGAAASSYRARAKTLSP
jgi:tetratricopeptide (TPR) repeat protein